MNSPSPLPMSPQIITASQVDVTRLQHLLTTEFAASIGAARPHIQNLTLKLSSANVVEASAIPADIVTMNSTIKLCDLDNHEVDTYTLVYPEEACIAEGKLSILSPLGSILLGSRAGENVTCRVADRESRKRIENISFQPERAGAFHL
ncbi:GreA/GreB family elongation factor [Roseimaritima multifibrata]|nr:GreA/GreB family elongation factor [Roseimaritima multifibrata]